MSQKLFVYERVLKYVKHSEFEKADTDKIKELLSSQVERLEKEVNKQIEYNKPLTGNIRDTLKELMQKELEGLSDTLKEPEPVQRLNILCKLIPYVLPRVDSVTLKLGGPDEF